MSSPKFVICFHRLKRHGSAPNNCAGTNTCSTALSVHKNARRYKYRQSRNRKSQVLQRRLETIRPAEINLFRYIFHTLPHFRHCIVNSLNNRYESVGCQGFGRVCPINLGFKKRKLPFWQRVVKIVLYLIATTAVRIPPSTI